MMPEEGSPESMAERIGAAVIGTVFIGVGLLILVLIPGETTWYHVVSLILGGLGLEAIISAIRSKRPLLSRIGPLP